MGLDQYAYRVKRGFIKKPVDFIIQEYDEKNDTTTILTEAVEIKYWRKHPNLQGYMEDLYYTKGGTSKEFNCVNVQLTWEDLEDLESLITEKRLPETEGFFFGDNSDDYYEKEDLEFIEDALKNIAKGYDIFYTSWW